MFPNSSSEEWGRHLIFALSVGIFLKTVKGIILLQGCLIFG